MSSPVLAVSRWTEVFETAESKRHRTLNWIAVPVSFNSTGLQRLLDEFDGHKAAALYGCWNALLKVAATAPVRGVLAGQKGESYTAGRLARLSGFPQDLFEVLIEWCLSVGWLVAAQQTPGLPDLTGPDLTKPNRTGPDTGDRAVPEVENSKAQKRSPGEAPASIVFEELLEIVPLLQQLDAVPVAASGKEIFGSVISRDRLKPEEIERADSGFWLAWYRDQLGSKSPMLTGGTLAEATFVLASVFAAKRCRNVDNKLAVWIKWLKARECKSITESDWKRAAERMSKQISDPQPARPREPPAETQKPIDSSTALSIDDVKSGWLKDRLQRRQKTS